MKESKTIEIKCTTQDHLNLAEMTELQGTLKERTDIDYDKIKLSIIKYGFSFPMFIWRDKKDKKNYLCDGHGRFATLCKMQKDGYEIPDLPVVYIDCKDKNEAKQKLLRLNSQYGKMTRESVLEFVGGEFELDTSEIALPDGNIDFYENVEECEFPDLASGDKQTLSTMTFTLSADQVETVKEALKKVGKVDSDENQNNNGNALAYICKEFLING